jgi:hypothetical protein
MHASTPRRDDRHPSFGAAAPESHRDLERANPSEPRPLEPLTTETTLTKNP